ncbi:MAG: hypothetical protein AAGP08_00875, partial [Pseudomonadota bacterium]
MNIIVPIHLEALRVTPSTNQQAKSALYDFRQLGTQASSSLGDLIASNRFKTAVTNLKNEPGVHLHWSLPRAYTRGIQDPTTGSVRYPVVPNRWLVVRTFKDNTKSTDNTRIRIWILESDAHVEQSDTLDLSDQTTLPTYVPWMNNARDLQGLQGNVAGRRIDLDGKWTEPTQVLEAMAASSAGGQTGFLGDMFQATYGYGETFTAFYPNCNNVLGVWDPFSDYFTNRVFQLDNNADFSASYGVMGWVSSTSSDEINVILAQALASYNALKGKKPDFQSYVSGVFQKNLGLSLSSYEGLTPSSISNVQGVVSGVLSDVKWQVKKPNQPSYPTQKPSSDGVSVSVGNNTPEALSAYIKAVESNNPALNTGSGVESDVEWLLNALQFNQLHELAAGSKGVGQLTSFLHSAAFSNEAGGYQWTVRQKEDSDKAKKDGANNEVPLAPYLAKLLAELNQKQRALDESRDNVRGRQKQLFLDWSNHISDLTQHVVNGPGDLGDDNSGAFLTDGMLQMFPDMLHAGNFREAGTPTAPYKPVYDAFSIQIPDNFPREAGQKLATYQFNTKPNDTGGAVVSKLLSLGYGLDEAAGLAFPSALASLETAQRLLNLADDAGEDADEYLTSAKKLVSQASDVLKVAATSLANLTDATSGLAHQAGLLDTTQKALAAVVDPTTGLFAEYLKYTPDPGKAPLPPGESYTGTLEMPFVNLLSWDAAPTGFHGIKAQIDEFTGQGGAPESPIDTAAAGLYLGYAYFFMNSPLIFKFTSAYYLQLCQTEIEGAVKSASDSSTALKAAQSALSSEVLTTVAAGLKAIVEKSIPAILSDLNQAQPDIAAALSEVQAMLATAEGDALSIPAMQAAARGSDWAALRGGIANAMTAVAERLPLAQQVALWNHMVNTNTADLFNLTAAPADHFEAPTEPVILLAQDKTAAGTQDLLSAFVRNGKASVIPCRWTSEIVTAAKPTTFPSPIDAIAANVDTKIAGLSNTLQALAEEMFLLTPELSDVVSKADLKAAADENTTLHYNKISHLVELTPAPEGLNGKLPYYTAYNWRQNVDPFLPLFIWWEADYQFSNTFDRKTQSYAADFLKQFELGTYEVELEPTAAAMPNFKAATTDGYRNSFSFHGLISLSSAATTSLCGQIQTYCKTYLNYDPASGPPQEGIDNYAEALKFYQSYEDYKTRDILSQGLSGFNAGLVTRAQELQIGFAVGLNLTAEAGR